MKYTLAQPAAWIMVSQRCPHAKPRTCEYVRLHDGRSEVTDGIKVAHLLTWTYEDHSRVYWWVQRNHQGPWMWTREAETQGESNLLWGGFKYLDFFLALKMESRGFKQRDLGALSSPEKARKWIFPQSPYTKEHSSSAHNLIFTQWNPSWTPTLQNSKTII